MEIEVINFQKGKKVVGIRANFIAIRACGSINNICINYNDSVENIEIGSRN